jgi:hypothetical protein
MHEKIYFGVYYYDGLLYVVVVVVAMLVHF